MGCYTEHVRIITWKKNQSHFSVPFSVVLGLEPKFFLPGKMRHAELTVMEYLTSSTLFNEKRRRQD